MNAKPVISFGFTTFVLLGSMMLHAQTIAPENNLFRTGNDPVELLGGHGFSLGRDEASAVWKERFLMWRDALP